MTVLVMLAMAKLGSTLTRLISDSIVVIPPQYSLCNMKGVMNGDAHRLVESLQCQCQEREKDKNSSIERHVVMSMLTRMMLVVAWSTSGVSCTVTPAMLVILPSCDQGRSFSQGAQEALIQQYALTIIMFKPRIA